MTDTIQPETAPWEEDSEFASEEFSADENELAIDTVSNTTDISDEAIPPEKAPLIDEIASEFVGFWNRLVSQTNWEKGKVIHTWRSRLIEAAVPRNVYTDDAIAKRIGNVSGQHVGRLRRVFETFGSSEKYPNLYWSHYQAALDWEDADNWLQKASSESLSVASMRIARWEKYGAPADRKPKENEIVTSEPDEDVNPFNDSNADFVDVGEPLDTGNDDKRKEKKSDKEKTDKPDRSIGQSSLDAADEPWDSGQTTGDVINAMNRLDPLPDDLTDAFEVLKVAVLNHKLTQWSEVEPQKVLAFISAIRTLVLCRD